MMIDFAYCIKKYNIKPKGVIQLGAHYFQEKEIFTSLGINDFVLVEPQQHAFNKILDRTLDVDAKLFRCAVSDYEGIMTMYCDSINQGQSSSLLKPKEHLNKYTNIKFDKTEDVEVRMLENMPFNRSKYNVLVMDLQGNELKALLGAGGLLDYIDCIHTEVNFIEMYEGCCLIIDLDEYLKEWNFERVETGENTNSQGWSDAFYVKT